MNRATRCLLAAGAFAAAMTGAVVLSGEAAGNGCPDRRTTEPTPTTCPKPSEPIEPTTTTTVPETTTVPVGPVPVDPAPTVPERSTTTTEAPVIGTPAVLDAEPAAPVTGETRYTG